jgi:hypothetical protein
MLCPICNNDEFYAHQMLRVDVIVDDKGNWEDNASTSLESCIYDAGTPYGPFRCTECGHGLEEL